MRPIRTWRLLTRWRATALDARAGRPPRPARARHTLTVVVGLTVVSAGAGWWAGRGIESPDDAARRAAAPPASPITAAVERRELATSVVVRGDVAFAQAVDVSADTDVGDRAGGPTVTVTGRVPRPGARLDEGDIAVELSGRPMFLLAGALPMYRALRPGATGADVRQLEQALRRLGHFAGVPNTVYDGRTAAAVTRLYRGAGYLPVGPSAEEKQQVLAAEARVKTATATLRQAETALDEARRPPRRSAVIAAEGAVRAARVALDTALRELQKAVDGGADPDVVAQRRAAVAEARDRLAVAEAQLAELTGKKETRAQQRAAVAARAEVAAARSALADVRKTVGVRVPRGELTFVASLPRRVDKVQAVLGKPATGAVLSLSGERIQVDASVSAEEQKLVKVGMRARIDDESAGVRLTGTVAAIAGRAGTDGAPPGSYHMRVTPAGGDPAELDGLNLRVTIPIRSTDGAVLAVPQAALVTDAAGTVRVRAARGDGFADVEVAVGLAADGFVEVTPAGGRLAEGDLVVVGSRQ